jgi:hypothetical protein
LPALIWAADERTASPEMLLLKQEGRIDAMKSEPAVAATPEEMTAVPTEGVPAPSAPAVRFFPPTVEELGRQWFDGPAEAPLSWSAGTATYPGTLKAFNATCTIARGVAKPGSRDVDPSHHAVAAIEKICSDLGYLLKLPVPPATLWFRRNPPTGHSSHVVVSTFPFDRLFTWSQFINSPLYDAAVRARLAAPASAMIPFDLWVGNPDRLHHENLLLSEDGEPAYIDFANALSFGWKNNGFDTFGEPGCFPSGLEPDLVVMSSVVNEIRKIEDSTIQAIVHKLPQNFLSTYERDLIVKGLVHRRGVLRSYMLEKFSGLQ